MTTTTLTAERLEDLLISSNSNRRISDRFRSISAEIQEPGFSYSTIDLITTALAVQNLNYTGKTESGQTQHDRSKKAALRGIYSRLDKKVGRELSDLVNFRGTDHCAASVRNSTLAAKTILYRKIASNLDQDVDADLLSAARKLTSSGNSWERKAENVINTLEDLRSKYGTLDFEEGSLNADIVSEMQTYIASNKILSTKKQVLKSKLEDVFISPVRTEECTALVVYQAPKSILPDLSFDPRFHQLKGGVRRLSPLVPEHLIEELPDDCVIYLDSVAEEPSATDDSFNELENDFFASEVGPELTYAEQTELIESDLPLALFEEKYERGVGVAATAMLSVAAAAMVLLGVNTTASLHKALQNDFTGPLVSGLTKKEISLDKGITGVLKAAVQDVDTETEATIIRLSSLEEGMYVLTALSQSEEVPWDIWVSSSLGIGVQNPIASLGPGFSYKEGNISDYQFLSDAEGIKVSSPFGKVRELKNDDGGPVLNASGGPLTRIHMGSDISLRTGTPLRSPIYPIDIDQTFTVCRHTGSDSGNYVSIKGTDRAGDSHEERMLHGDSFGPFFFEGGPKGRCAELTLADKDSVLMYAGNTGRSFGPHLHHESYVNGRPVDSEDMIYNPLRPVDSSSIGPDITISLDMPESDAQKLKEQFSTTAIDGYADAAK